MKERTIRVFIVDDHPIVRHGLSIFLETWDDLENAGEAENGEEAVALVEQNPPDVVLMDLIMPVMDGITATRLIRQKFPHIQVVILSNVVEPQMIAQALEAGAHSHMYKDVTLEELAKKIRGAVKR
jgi:two-component system, NarL family, response regulator LiaR